MSSDDGYRADLDQVRNLFMPEAEHIAVQDLTRVACSFGDSRASVDAPPIAMPAKLALQEALDLLRRSFENIQGLLSDTNDDVAKAMKDYECADNTSATSLGAVAARLHTPVGTDPHSYLVSQDNQVRENVAEIGVRDNFDQSQVNLRPGDMLTTMAGRLLVVGQDGGFYENGTPVGAPTGEEVRMYRRMTAASGLAAGGGV